MIRSRAPRVGRSRKQHRVRAFLLVVGTVFGLIVVAHIARMVDEPARFTDPWFWLLTVLAATLSAWAFYLFRTARRS